LKRILIWTIVLAVVGCDQQQAQKQHNEATALLEEGRQLLVSAAAGTRHDKWTPQSSTIMEYRQSRWAEAADKVRPVGDSGSPSQKMAARLLIAETHASVGRANSRQATLAWAQQTGRITQFTGIVAALRADEQSTASYSTTSFDEPLARVQQSLGELTAAREAAAD
jgi:hypothetical protein